MTIKNLIKILQNFPQNKNIGIIVNGHDENYYGIEQIIATIEDNEISYVTIEAVE